ncbi:MAG: hypothetical protein ABIC82_01715 [bacterium]
MERSEINILERSGGIPFRTRKYIKFTKILDKNKVMYFNYKLENILK